MKARQRLSIPDNHAPLILGVDPARNKDRAAIVFRKGREIINIITYENTGDDIWLADKIISFIEKYEPAIVNIDCTNSWAIHDYIRQKGYGKVIRGYHFGENATDHLTYANKRAEIWCLLRDWLKEDDVKIPDDNDLHADLTCVPDYDETDGKIRLAKKEDIKNQMGFSPDIGDAAALTFATRINSTMGQPKKVVTSSLKTQQRFKKKR
jgi:hypothetical protein